jgi:membrane fusion protein (multidrug efflux system)
MRKILLIIVGTIISASLLYGCGKGAAKIAKKDSAIPVKIMKVALEDLDKALEYVGNIKGRDEAVVYPKVSGKIVEKVKEDGSPVLKGDVIAYIDRDEVGLKFEKAPVESPLTGAVGRVYVDIGSSVNPQTAIALVADMTEAQINLDIPEKYLPHVSVGQDAEIMVDAYPGEKFIGKVTMISPVVDLATRSAPIEIMIDNRDSRLQSGMFAKVRLIIEKIIKSPVVIREAVIGRDPDTYVYVVVDNKAVLRKVLFGVRQGPYVQASAGLEEGESVVVMGQQRLRDGADVITEE